jgi:hypothetical protein
LIGISLDEKQFDEIVSPADVQMYLETAGVGGKLTYFYQKPSYSFANNFYYADLRNIDTLPRWTASIIFLSLVGVVWLGVGVFVLFKQGGHAPFVLHFARFVWRRLFFTFINRSAWAKISIWRSAFWTTSPLPFSFRFFCIFAFVIRSETKFSTARVGKLTRFMFRQRFRLFSAGAAYFHSLRKLFPNSAFAS